MIPLSVASFPSNATIAPSIKELSSGTPIPTNPEPEPDEQRHELLVHFFASADHVRHKRFAGWGRGHGPDGVRGSAFCVVVSRLRAVLVDPRVRGFVFYDVPHAPPRAKTGVIRFDHDAVLQMP